MENQSNIPKLLQEIPDAPKRLYKRGELPDPNTHHYLTVIGSRKFTQYGKQVCEKLINDLTGYPFVIVSGLALGIDTIAHESALKSKLPTIAIPGSGLDDSVIYPRSNLQLAHRIIQSGGCLISEFEPEFKAANWSFPQRNRIMAGISHATLVIEAENKSGTRITARLATDYNREVFTVPGSIFSPSSEGTNQLIREGATPVTSSSDILDFFGYSDSEPVQLNLELLEPNERAVIEYIIDAKSRNDIAQHLNMPIHKLNILLSSMEIKGLVSESLGKIYRS